MRYFIFIILYFVVLSQLHGQNLIRNGGFEQAAVGNYWSPNDAAEVNRCRFWETDQRGADKTNVVHSPDWFFNSGNHTILKAGLNTINANSGFGFVGMGVAEMIQQNLTNSIDPNKSYKFEAYIQLPNHSSLSVHNITDNTFNTLSYNDVANWPTPFEHLWSFHQTIYLDIFYSKRKMKYEYDDLSTCDSDLLDKQNNGSPILVKRIPLSLSRYNVNEWIKVETFLDPINENGYDWINIEISNCFAGVLLDDVKLIQEHCVVCDNCSYYGGCIDLTFNTSHEQGGQCTTIFGLDNVSHFEMEIKQLSSGNIIRTVNIDNPPSIFCWDGLDNNGNPYNHSAVSGSGLQLKVNVKNNCQIKEYNFPINFPGLGPSSDASQCTCSGSTNTTNNPIVPDKQCCEDDLYINHIIIDEDITYRANRIFVGPNVIIQDGATVTFHAKVEIDISPDFKAEVGADWLAYIDDNCVEDDYGRVIPIGNGEVPVNNNGVYDNSNDKNNKEGETNNIPNTTMLVYPNPSSGIINIELSETKNDALIQVFDMSGKLLKTRIAVSNRIKLDLSNYPKGIYFVRLKQKSEVITRKIIIE